MSSCGQGIQTLTGSRAEEESLRCDSCRKGICGAYGEYFPPPPPHVTQFHYLDFFNAMFLYILKVKEKRKQLKKEGKPLDVEEDDPEMVSSTEVLRLLL